MRYYKVLKKSEISKFFNDLLRKKSLLMFKEVTIWHKKHFGNIILILENHTIQNKNLKVILINYNYLWLREKGLLKECLGKEIEVSDDYIKKHLAWKNEVLIEGAHKLSRYDFYITSFDEFFNRSNNSNLFLQKFFNLEEQKEGLQSYGEALLWKIFDELGWRNKYKIEGQKQIGNYRVDFFFNEINLILELDGEQHKNTLLQDFKRDLEFLKKGYRVYRMNLEDLKENPKRELYKFIKYVESLVDKIPYVTYQKDEINKIIKNMKKEV